MSQSADRQNDNQLESDTIGLLYAGLGSALAANTLLALILAAVQKSVIDPNWVAGWLVLFGMVLLGRGGLLMAWRRYGQNSTLDALRWLSRFRTGAVLTGLCWGGGTLLLFPVGNVAHQVFLAFVLAGVSAGAVTTLAVDRISVYGFLFPTLLPITLRLFIEGGDISLAMGVMSGLFLLFLLMSAHRSGQLLYENVRLRIESGAREQLLQHSTIALRQARDMAESASHAKSEFLASMSHELRTPLNAIIGFSQLLATDPVFPEEGKGQIREIERAGQHLLSLVTDMIDLARIEAGGMKLSMEPVSVSSVITASLEMVWPLARKMGIEVFNACEDGLSVAVNADNNRLRQVLINLLSNAIKYNRQNGRVTLDCHLNAGRLRISVTDTGHGIAADMQDRIFNAFDRLGAECGTIEGTGIGLIITKRIVEAMGGSIGFESQQGQGSLFWIELTVDGTAEPSITPESSIADAPVPGISVQHSERPMVLYVEDNPMNMRLMQQIFAKRRDLALRGADSAETGIEMARTEQPALILMDINLPGMNGYQALAQLKADPNTTHIPVIAVSANAMKGDRERGLAAGFSAYVTKPLNIPGLNDTMDALISRPVT